MNSDWVNFGPDKESKDRKLYREHLEKYSKLYQDLVTETGNSNINEIDMPNVFGQFNHYAFKYLSQKLNHDQDSELYEDGLLLADALDMEEIINDEVKGYNESFNYIVKNPLIFKIYFKYSHPYVLLDRMKNAGGEILKLAQKHLDDFIQKEKKEGYPSNMTCYRIFDKYRDIHDFNLIEGRFSSEELRKYLFTDDTSYIGVEEDFLF